MHVCPSSCVYLCWSHMVCLAFAPHCWFYSRHIHSVRHWEKGAPSSPQVPFPFPQSRHFGGSVWTSCGRQHPTPPLYHSPQELRGPWPPVTTAIHGAKGQHPQSLCHTVLNQCCIINTFTVQWNSDTHSYVLQTADNTCLFKHLQSHWKQIVLKIKMKQK